MALLTKGQLKALHAAARARRLDHAALREMAGVDSLSQLTIQQASALLDRLNGNEGGQGVAQGAGQGVAQGVAQSSALHQRGPRRNPDTIRTATPAQRKYLADLFESLAAQGWPTQMLSAFLRRQLIGDGSLLAVREHQASSAAYRAAITQFEALRGKPVPAPRVHCPKCDGASRPEEQDE